MIVGGQTEARARLSSTIIDYHEPFDQGLTVRSCCKSCSIPNGKLLPNFFLLSSFLIGFSFSLTVEKSSPRKVSAEDVPRKTFKEEIGQESNGAANQEIQIFLLCQISPSASSTRDLETRLSEDATACFPAGKRSMMMIN